MRINSIQSNNNYNQNFGAEILCKPGTLYFRTQSRFIAKSENWEQKNLLLSLLKVIKNDKNFDTFEMTTKDVTINRESLNQYCFTLTGKDKEIVIEHTPQVSDVQLNAEYYKDKHFLEELEYFIIKQYGKDVYEQALEDKPEYVKEYLQMQSNMNNSLKEEIKETLNLEPLNYLLSKDGRKIPANDLGIPIEDYVC